MSTTPDRRAAARARAELARRGEAAAADHLREQGYRILAANLRVGDDEADLLALAPTGALVVVEVKTRAGPWHPEDRVDQVKRHRLVRLATALSREPAWSDRMLQFDVVAVEAPPSAPLRVLHYPHAFDAG